MDLRRWLEQRHERCGQVAVDGANGLEHATFVTTTQEEGSIDLGVAKGGAGEALRPHEDASGVLASLRTILVLVGGSARAAGDREHAHGYGHARSRARPRT